MPCTLCGIHDAGLSSRSVSLVAMTNPLAHRVWSKLSFFLCEPLFEIIHLKIFFFRFSLTKEINLNLFATSCRSWQMQKRKIQLKSRRRHAPVPAIYGGIVRLPRSHLWTWTVPLAAGVGPTYRMCSGHLPYNLGKKGGIEYENVAGIYLINIPLC